MELNELLKEMNADVIKYIKNYDIDVLYLFISKYIVNRKFVVKVLTDSENAFFDNFREWVRIYYKADHYATAWAGYILLYCDGNHEKAVKKFFELYKMWYKEEFNKEPW